MDRALDPGLLGLALGGRTGLPSVQELGETLADVEVELLLGRTQAAPALLDAGWYLHAVASSADSLQRYGIERQRACFQVSAHVFDLALRSLELDLEQRLELCFASQIAYLRGELDPNSIAVYRRVLPEGLPEVDLMNTAEVAALLSAVALLAGDVGEVFGKVRHIRRQVDRVVERWGLTSIAQVGLGVPALVCDATWHLMVFLVYGRSASLERGQESLKGALGIRRDPSNLRSAWLASHLLDVSKHLGEASVWTALPPEVPDGVRRAFSMASPQALTLWPPQLDLLRMSDDEGPPSILSPAVCRAVVSTPTSGGKTLLAQILLVDHIATRETGVCYVAPTRALCAEVRDSLRRRLRYIRANLSFQSDSLWAVPNAPQETPLVEVMTPERLAFLLRQDPQRVLEQFGLFIIDEVHTLADGERGWVLEQVLTFLHYRTRDTHHRIVCLSASVGNRHQLAAWLDEGTVVQYHRPWRGPRRIHCLWNIKPAWDEVEILQARSPAITRRERFAQYGFLGIRRGQTDVAWYKTSEPVGALVLDTRGGRRTRNGSMSTALYRMRTELIAHLADTGPVLVVESTRQQALLTAKAVADTQDRLPNAEVQPLLDLVAARLGEEHPLAGLVSVGVAYHHGSLPFEIRRSIEDAVRGGTVRCLVATATMTEGVNLPVRSVIVGSQGSYGADGYREYITGARLINAVGRAGRATRETEGVLILAVSQDPSMDHFDALQPGDEALAVESALMAESALEELAVFERALLEAEDAVFRSATGIVGGFISFVWFVSDQFEELGAATTPDAIDHVLANSLAWIQMPEELTLRWQGVAEAGLEALYSASRPRRSRWAKSSARPRSVRVLEELSDDIAATIRDDGPLTDPIPSIEALLSDERLPVFTELAEYPGRRFFTSRGGQHRREVPINLRQLALDWVSGAELHELASHHLSAVGDVDYRFEQLGDFINEYFEIFLPWLVGILQQWVDQKVELADGSAFPTDLSALLRWGVDRSPAVTLMMHGVRSRRLAIAIARVWEAEGQSETVLEWLRALPQTEWEQRFEPSLLELRSLLEVSRREESELLSEVLAGRRVTLPVHSARPFADEAPAVLSTQLDVYTSPVRIEVGGEVVGEVRNEDRLDLREILKLGIPLSVSFEADFTAFLHLRLEDV